MYSGWLRGPIVWIFFERAYKCRSYTVCIYISFNPIFLARKAYLLIVPTKPYLLLCVSWKSYSFWDWISTIKNFFFPLWIRIRNFMKHVTHSLVNQLYHLLCYHIYLQHRIYLCMLMWLVKKNNIAIAFTSYFPSLPFSALSIKSGNLDCTL